MAISFKFSPQVSDHSRTQYFFQPQDERITLRYVTGATEIKKIDGLYTEVFIPKSEKDYVLDFAGTKTLEEMNDQLARCPIRFLIEYGRDGIGDVKVRLLKQYQQTEGSDPRLSFPDWYRVSDAKWDHEISDLKTELSPYMILISKARGLFNELITECWNVAQLEADEIRRFNAAVPPYGSPITVRSLKISLLELTFVYIESVANFLSSLALSVDGGINGCPSPICRLSATERAHLEEKSGFVRLEEKLISYPELLSRLYHKGYKLDVSNHHWGLFKQLKRKRDAVTHVRFKPEDSLIDLRIDVPRPAVEISDETIFDAVRVIYWINEAVTRLFDDLGLQKGYSNTSFNDVLVLRMLFEKLASLAEKDVPKILAEYSNWGHTEQLLRLLYRSQNP